MFRQNPQDKEQPVCAIWDYVIGEDGVSVMTAVTDNPHYAERVFDALTISKIGYGPVIVGMDVAFTFGSADRTGFHFRNKFGHISVKENFR